MDDVTTMTPLGRTVWHSNYQLAAGHGLPEEHIGDTWRRVSRAIAAAEAGPVHWEAAMARSTRRIGIGITGLADALAMLGLRYGSDAGRDFASRIMVHVRDTAYATSIQLALEKGAFP